MSKNILMKSITTTVLSFIYSPGCIKRIVCNKITVLNTAKLNYTDIKRKNLKYCSFSFSKSKLVKECFVELLSRITKNRFIPALIHMYICTLFVYEIYREKVICIGQFIVYEMLTTEAY